MPTPAQIAVHCQNLLTLKAAEENKAFDPELSPTARAAAAKQAAFYEHWLVRHSEDHRRMTGKPCYWKITDGPIVIEAKSPQRIERERLEAEQEKVFRDQFDLAHGLVSNGLYLLQSNVKSNWERLRNQTFMTMTAVLLGGGSHATLIAIQNRVFPRVEKLLADARAAYRKGERGQAMSLLESAAREVRRGEAALAEHQGSVESGCGRAIAIIKVWQVAATGGLTGGLSGMQAVGAEMASQAGTEAGTLLMQAADPGNTVSLNDVLGSTYNVAAAGLGAKAGDFGKTMLGPYVFKILNGRGIVGEGAKELLEESAKSFCANNSKATMELLMKAAKGEKLDQAGINYLVATVSAGLKDAGAPLPESEVRDLVIQELTK